MRACTQPNPGSIGNAIVEQIEPSTSGRSSSRACTCACVCAIHFPFASLINRQLYSSSLHIFCPLPLS